MRLLLLLLLPAVCSSAAPSRGDADADLLKLNRPSNTTARPVPLPPAPAPTPAMTKEQAEKEGHYARYREIYARLLEGSKAPDFTMWWEEERPPWEPTLEIVDSRDDIAHFLDFGSRGEIRVFHGPFKELARNDDEMAYILAHELMHYLSRERRPVGKDFREECRDFIGWFAKNRPALHAAWRKKADRIAKSAGRMSEQKEREFKDHVILQACVSHAAADLEAYVTWRAEYEKPLLSQRREHEALADHWAWKLSEVSGFEPRRGHLFFARLGTQETRAAWALFESHYPSSLRAEELKRYADSKYQWMPPSSTLKP